YSSSSSVAESKRDGMNKRRPQPWPCRREGWIAGSKLGFVRSAERSVRRSDLTARNERLFLRSLHGLDRRLAFRRGAASGVRLLVLHAHREPRAGVARGDAGVVLLTAAAQV